MTEPEIKLDMPPFPPLTRDDFSIWEGDTELRAWKRFDTRKGSYALARVQRRKPGVARMSISVPNGDPHEHLPSAEQVAGYRYLLEHQATIHKAILASVFKNYPSWRAEYAEGYGITDRRELARVLPVLSRPAELAAVMRLATVHISTVSLGGVSYIGFECGCLWEQEHGLGVLTHRCRVVTVGHADVCFLEWIAEDDAKKQKKRKR